MSVGRKLINSFLTAPSLPGMPHESHPFSISNVPPPPCSSGSQVNEAMFLIRAHGGFTSRLLESVTSTSPLAISTGGANTDRSVATRHSSKTDVPSVSLALEGPYGHDHPLEHYHTVVLVAGGTGVTFCLSYFMRLLQPFARDRARSGKYVDDRVDAEDNQALLAGDTDTDTDIDAPTPTPAWRTCLRRLKLIWHVREIGDVEWIAPMLNTALDALGLSHGYDEGDDWERGSGEAGEMRQSECASKRKWAVAGGLFWVDVSVDVYVTRATPSQHLTLSPPTRNGTSSTHPRQSFRPASPPSSQADHLNQSRSRISRPITSTPDADQIIAGPIGSSFRPPINLAPARDLYEGSSAEGLLDPARHGRYPLSCMATQQWESSIPVSAIANETHIVDDDEPMLRHDRGDRAEDEYALNPDDDTDDAPLLGTSPSLGHRPFAPSAKQGKEDDELMRFSTSLGSGYGSTGSSIREPSAHRPRTGRSRGSSSTLCSIDNRSDTSSQHKESHQPRPSSRSVPTSSYGLSGVSRSYIRLHPGRADLTSIIPQIADGTNDLSGSTHASWNDGQADSDRHAQKREQEVYQEDEGDMIVVTCGPVPLMHDTRRAVWAANSPKRVREGRRVVQLLEETVGH